MPLLPQRDWLEMLGSWRRCRQRRDEKGRSDIPPEVGEYIRDQDEIFGRADSDSSEGKVLNRVIRVTDDGWEYEPDQRHADIIISELGLQDAKPSATLGDDEKKWEEEENAVLLCK